MDAFIELSNISITEDSVTRPLYQKLSVEFKWTVSNITTNKLPENTSTSNSQNSTSKILQIPYARSGNPGYIIGKPVLVGFRVKPNPDKNDSKETAKENDSSSTKQDIIQLSHVPLSLQGSSSNGMKL